MPSIPLQKGSGRLLMLGMVVFWLGLLPGAACIAAESTGESAAARVEDTTRKVVQKVQKGVETVQEKSAEIVGETVEAAADAGRYVRDGAEAAVDVIGEKAEQISNKIKPKQP